MCFPFPKELESFLEENLKIYCCKRCSSRSLKVDGKISIKAEQPDGWGCDCEDPEFEMIEVIPIGRS